MSFIGLALVASLLIAGVTTVLSAIGTKHLERTLLTGAGTGVVLFILNWALNFFMRPTVGFSGMSFYKNWWMWAIEWLIAIVVIGLTASSNDRPTVGSWIMIAAFGSVMLYSVIQFAGGTWNQSRATTQAERIVVDIKKQGEYPPTDSNHIMMVPQQVAKQIGSSALTSGDTRNLGTRYVNGDYSLQIVNGHMYWLSALRPDGYRNYSKVNGTSPGFTVVDAEDPSQPASVRRQDAQKKDYGIKYTLSGTLGGNLERHVWANGYSGSRFVDWTFEVDDNWKPYWTATLDQLTYNFQGTVPNKLIVVDAQSGEITTYPIDKAPAWVDRIYSDDHVKSMLGWWGNWGQAPYKSAFAAKSDRYKVVDGQEPTLVYTKDGHAKWQVQMTSLNSDTTVAYLAMFDSRTNKVDMYEIDNLATEDSVKSSILNASWNTKKLRPAHLSLHLIFGRLTWVAPMMDPEEGDEDGSKSAWQGITFLNATGAVGANSSYNTDGQLALSNYQSNADRTNQGKLTAEEQAQLKTLSGIVDRVRTGQEGNNTVVYFTLKGDTSHLYHAVLRPEDKTSMAEVALIERGSNVTIGYEDTKGPRREVRAYDDHDLQLAA